MKKGVIILILLFSASLSHALTLKSGQVIGGDGNIYDGASPEKQKNLIANAQNGGDIAGLSGASVYVVVGDTITYVPIGEIRGKTNNRVKEIIGDEVIQNVTGIDDLSLSDIENATLLAEEAGIPLEDLLNSEGLEGIDPETMAEIAAVASETGIEFDNLVAVSTVLETLPEEQFNQITEDLGNLIAEGFADEINETLNELSEIEGGLDNFLNFNSVAECEAAGAQNCSETAAAVGDGPSS